MKDTLPPRGRARRALFGAAALATTAGSAFPANAGGRAGAASAASPDAATSAAAANLISVLVELEPGVDEARWREAQLQPLGGEVRGRLRHVRDALIVELPRASLERLRRLPGVRRVTIPRDARTGPPPPQR